MLVEKDFCKCTEFLLVECKPPGPPPPPSSLATFLKLENPRNVFPSHKCFELDLCDLCFFSFSLESEYHSLPPRSEDFSSLKRKAKGNFLGFLRASHLFFVDSIPARLFLSPEPLSSAWNLRPRYFNDSNSLSSDARF